MDEIKLQLKDIAGYLPYCISCLNKEGELRYISDMYIGEPDCDLQLFDDNGKLEESYIEDIKPILRPMEDVTREIVVEGYNGDKPFTPLIEIAKACYPDMKGWRIDDEGRAYTRDNGYPHWITPENVELATFEIFDMLNQWHFDYRGLIKKGLAVDINTIKR